MRPASEQQGGQQTQRLESQERLVSWRQARPRRAQQQAQRVLQQQVQQQVWSWRPGWQQAGWKRAAARLSRLAPRQSVAWNVEEQTSRRTSLASLRVTRARSRAGASPDR